jgi:hypothetical protein
MKVFVVQEIWGDGDSEPSLRYLKVFETIDKSISHCQKRFEQLKKDHPQRISEDHMVIINKFDDDEHYDFYNFEASLIYGDFSCFLVKEYEVL